MSRDFRLFVVDIAECSERARQYTSSHTFETFCDDQRTIDAVIRNIEVIGEAVKQIPTEVLAEFPEIEWSQLARFRDLVIHHYFKIKLTIIWDAVQNEFAPLAVVVQKLLSKYPATDD